MIPLQKELTFIKSNNTALKNTIDTLTATINEKELLINNYVMEIQKSNMDKENAANNYNVTILELKESINTMNAKHNKQMASSLQIQRDAENTNNEKIRKEHKNQIDKITKNYEKQITTITNTYKEEILENQEHYLREKKTSLDRYNKNIEKLEMRHKEDKDRALDDCIELNKKDLEIALQTLHKEHVQRLTKRDNEWTNNFLELRTKMEDEKEKAIASCLTSTLEEMSSALEEEQKKRREQVRATREQWRNQLKTTVDTMNEQHKKEFVEFKNKLNENTKEQLISVIEETKREAEKEHRKELKGIKKELDNSIHQMKVLETSLLSSQQKCKEVEEALVISRQKRQLAINADANCPVSINKPSIVTFVNSIASLHTINACS